MYDVTREFNEGVGKMKINTPKMKSLLTYEYTYINYSISKCKETDVLYIFTLSF